MDMNRLALHTTLSRRLMTLSKLGSLMGDPPPAAMLRMDTRGGA